MRTGIKVDTVDYITANFPPQSRKPNLVVPDFDKAVVSTRDQVRLLTTLME